MGLNYECYRFDCNDVTHKAERKWSAATREARAWLLVIATGLCLLAEDWDTLIEQSLL